MYAHQHKRSTCLTHRHANFRAHEDRIREASSSSERDRWGHSGTWWQVVELRCRQFYGHGVLA